MNIFTMMRVNLCRGLVPTVLLIGLLVGLCQPLAAQFGGPVTVIADTSVPALTTASSSTAIAANTAGALAQATAQTATQTDIAATGHTSLAGQVAHYAEVASRWLTTVEHYSTTVFNYVRQFTSLRGILTFAGKQLGLKDDDLKAIREVMAAYDGVMNLKRQFENLLQTRLALIRNWEARAKNGIFNPEQDWQDLKDYLRATVGRNQVNDDLLLHLSEKDPEYARWQEDLKRLRKRETELLAERKALLEAIEREKNLSGEARPVTTDENGGSISPTGRVSSSAPTVIALQANLQAVEQQLIALQAQLRDLLDKMGKRYTEAFWQMYSQWERASAVGDTSQGWERFGDLKLTELGNLVDYAGPPPEQPTLDLTGLPLPTDTPYLP